MSALPESHKGAPDMIAQPPSHPPADASAPAADAIDARSRLQGGTEHVGQDIDQVAAEPMGIPFPAPIGPLTVPGPSPPLDADMTATNTAAVTPARSASSGASIKAKEKVRAGLIGEDEKVATQLNAAEEKKEAIAEVPATQGKKKGFFARRKAKDESDKKDKEKDKEAAALPPVGFTALFRYATPFELFLNALGLFLAAAAGATQPLMTLIFGRLANSFTEFGVIQANIQANGLTVEAIVQLQEAQASLKRESGHNALYLLAIGIGMFLATYAYMLIWNYTGEIGSKRLREAYLRGVLKQDIAYFDDLGAGEVATRIQSDCHLVQEGTSEKVANATMYAATFVTGFALAYARSWRLALAMTSIFPVIMITGGIMFGAMSKFTVGSLEHVAKAGTLAEEVIGSIRTMHAFGTSLILGEKFDKHILTSRNTGRKGSIIEAFGLSIMFWSIYCAYALAFFYGGILVTQGHADVGIVINVFMSILIGSFSVALLAPELAAVTKARAAAAKLFDTIDRVPPIDSSNPGGLRPEHVEGRIELRGVKFHYPSRPNVPILKGLDASFPAGNSVALVGASGSGKSTVISLVERFYDPHEGQVLLDGVDIKTLNVKWLRQQIGLVSQEPTLFATTVRGNVEHGLIGSKWEHVSDEERFELVKKACIDANAHDFIVKLPNGYETNVGERGMLLSGGQKQRVAIARAIVSDPRILLLDEATSALDTQSEGIVQDALDKASKGRTTITIAHRLSTIKDADNIIVMGGGEILEQGTHNDLLADENGPYAQLVSNQKLNQTSGGKVDVDSDSEDDSPGAMTSDERLDRLASPHSPAKEKGSGFPGLNRAMTGRSVASAAMEAVQAKRAEEEVAADKIPSAWKLYARLLRLNRQDKWYYILGVVGAICNGMVYPALAILFGQAIQSFQIQDPDGLKSALTEKARYYFITAFAAAFVGFVQIFCFARTGWNLTAKLRSLTFAATLKHDIEWFDEEKNSTGAVTSNIADWPQKVQGLFGPTMGTIVQSVGTLVGGMIIGLVYSPKLAAIGIACMPLLISGGYLRLKVVVLKDQKLKKIHAASAHLASEAAGAVKTVASLTREDDMDRIYSHALETPLRISTRGALKSNALYAASQGMSFLVIALIFYVGSLWLSQGDIDSASFFTVLTAVVFATIQAGNVFSFVPDASKANGSAASIFHLADNQPEIDALSSAGIHLKPEEVVGHVRLENIHFRYPTRPGVRVLRDLTLDVPPGTYVALVGPSGCGKSTTVQMLERFYDPLIGRVTLDGKDVKELNVANYRSHMALVSQEPTLYAGSVRFNVLLGANKPMEEVTEEEVVQACKDANIYDFIMSLPDGFDTEVGGKGSQLSGGQKQRIAIARALIRNPKILLLDEATSALDSQSERVVQEALDKAAKGRTTIAIAHRLSTIQKADIIYCFAEGRVKEKGTHQELINKRGAYYELVQMQNLSRQA